MKWRELYPVTEEEEAEIWRINGVTKEKIVEDSGILEDWYKKQRHFPEKYPYEHFLTRNLALNQYNVEATKKKIETHLTLKNVHHEFYNAFNVDNIVMPTEMLPTFLPMPKLMGPKNQRIYVSQWKTSDFSKFSLKHCEQLVIYDLEFAVRFDRAISAVVVLDAKNTRMEMFKKLDPLRVVRMVHLVFNMYEADTIAELHVINLTKPAQVLFNFLKTVVHNNIIDRVYVHNDFQSLYKVVPEEYLPEELGGTQGSLSTIISLMEELILENKQFLLDLPKFAADESLRLGESHYSNMYGTEGTFRRLNID